MPPPPSALPSLLLCPQHSDGRGALKMVTQGPSWHSLAPSLAGSIKKSMFY